jgi:hypothetical protein
MAIVAMLLLSGCGLIVDPELGEARRNLNVSKSLWRARGYSNYDFVISNQCFCVLGGVPVRVSVRNGVVVAAVYVNNDHPLTGEISTYYKDVIGYFKVIEDAIDSHPASIRANYDSGHGYPVDVFIDYDSHAADEEFGFAITSLTPM